MAQEHRYSNSRAHEDLVGRSSAFQRVLCQIPIIAPTNSTTLIHGETGTGKEVIARAIHNGSRRANGPFVKVNCAAIPGALLESEFFGHERGAFTGAIAQTKGRFEQANNGTLFLDEIGDLPLDLQPKLLRVLQEREVEPLGSRRTIPVDVRIVAATNHDLARLVASKQFRADLYYRLNVVPIYLPPLRQRLEDIPELVNFFIKKFAERLNKRIESIPDEVMESMKRHDWPGNIRELQNFIERAMVLSPGSVLRPPLSDLKQIAGPELPASSRTLAAAERDHILKALNETKGMVGGRYGAAALLGLPRTTLLHKMSKLGIETRRSQQRQRVAADRSTVTHALAAATAGIQ